MKIRVHHMTQEIADEIRLVKNSIEDFLIEYFDAFRAEREEAWMLYHSPTKSSSATNNILFLSNKFSLLKRNLKAAQFALQRLEGQFPKDPKLGWGEWLKQQFQETVEAFYEVKEMKPSVKNYLPTIKGSCTDLKLFIEHTLDQLPKIEIAQKVVNKAQDIGNEFGFFKAEGRGLIEESTPLSSAKQERLNRKREREKEGFTPQQKLFWGLGLFFLQVIPATADFLAAPGQLRLQAEKLAQEAREKIPEEALKEASWVGKILSEPTLMEAIASGKGRHVTTLKRKYPKMMDFLSPYLPKEGEKTSRYDTLQIFKVCSEYLKPYLNPYGYKSFSEWTNNFWKIPPKEAINQQDETGKTSLMTAAQLGKGIETAQALITAGADVSLQDHEGKTALTHAIESGQQDVAELLLDHEVKPQFSDIHEAWRQGDKQMVEQLIEKRGGINAQDDNGETLLFFGVSRGKEDFIKFLLEHGADANAKNNDGQSPLFKMPFESTTNLLLKYGAQINIQDKGGNTPLIEVARKHATDWKARPFLRLLVERGADIHIRNAVGESVLSVVAESGERQDILGKIVNFLLDRGAVVGREEKISFVKGGLKSGSFDLLKRVYDFEKPDLTLSDPFDPSDSILKGVPLGGPLLNILIREHYPFSTIYQVLHLLARHGADFNIPDPETHDNTLETIARRGFLNTLKLLKAVIGNPKQQNPAKLGELFLLTNVESTEGLCFLIDQGIFDQETQIQDCSFFAQAVIWNKKELVEELLKRKWDVNRREAKGLTLLHIATALGNEEIVDTLLGAGADPSLKDETGHSALDYTPLFKRTALIDKLARREKVVAPSPIEDPVSAISSLPYQAQLTLGEEIRMNKELQPLQKKAFPAIYYNAPLAAKGHLPDSYDPLNVLQSVKKEAKEAGFWEELEPIITSYENNLKAGKTVLFPQFCRSTSPDNVKQYLQHNRILYRHYGSAGLWTSHVRESFGDCTFWLSSAIVKQPVCSPDPEGGRSIWAGYANSISMEDVMFISVAATEIEEMKKQIQEHGIKIPILSHEAADFFVKEINKKGFFLPKFWGEVEANLCTEDHL